MEASEIKRNHYKELIKDLNPREFVYIDESGIDHNEVKDRGWGKKSERLVGKKSGKYYQRTNIVSGYVNKRSIANERCVAF